MRNETRMSTLTTIIQCSFRSPRQSRGKQNQIKGIQTEKEGVKLSPFAIYAASQVVLVVKNLPVGAGNIGDVGSVPGLRRSPGIGHDNSLKYSSLENPMDRGPW